MKCKRCRTEYFNRGHCLPKGKGVSCEGLKLIYNEGKPLIKKKKGAGE